MRRLKVKVNGQWYEVELGDIYRSPVEVTVDGGQYLVELEGLTGTTSPSVPIGTKKNASPQQPGLRSISEGNDGNIRCPLPGKVLSVAVKKGQRLEEGDEICSLESMKMEQSIRSSQRGIIKSVKIKRNQNLKTGAILVEIQR